VACSYKWLVRTMTSKTYGYQDYPPAIQLTLSQEKPWLTASYSFRLMQICCIKDKLVTATAAVMSLPPSGELTQCFRRLKESAKTTGSPGKMTYALQGLVTLLTIDPARMVNPNDANRSRVRINMQHLPNAVADSDTQTARGTGTTGGESSTAAVVQMQPPCPPDRSTISRTL
jgi:hypothetical protein